LVNQSPILWLEDRKGEPQRRGKYLEEDGERGTWERDPIKLFMNA
jgi:hypothetical protein